MKGIGSTQSPAPQRIEVDGALRNAEDYADVNAQNLLLTAEPSRLF